ncbi:MAG: hypothetical protein KDK39_03720 [Leptospiraceae bacterium]|nr:hypothetical protein [Leptospiraceae bacterium]
MSDSENHDYLDNIHALVKKIELFETELDVIDKHSSKLRNYLKEGDDISVDVLAKLSTQLHDFVESLENHHAAESKPDQAAVDRLNEQYHTIIDSFG